MDNSKKIRLLSVEIYDRPPMVYLADKPRPITINNIRTTRTITNIELVDNHFEIYISEGSESRHWKDIPKNDKVSVEYYIY